MSPSARRVLQTKLIKHPAFYVDGVQFDYPQPRERVAFTPPWA